jgi:stage II sporulation protein D
VNSKLSLVLPLALVFVAAGCRTTAPPKPVPKPAPQTPAARPAEPPAAPAPVPAPRPQQPRPAPAPAPAEPVESGIEAPWLLKVGLASDLESVTFPCCEEGLRATLGDRGEPAVPVAGVLRVEPAAATASQGFYRIQAAALRDERQAQNLAQRLQRETGQPGEAWFDAGIDLYRVRVGRYPTREDADRELRRLTTIGVTGAFVVSDGAGITSPALRLIQGGVSQTYPGRWLAVDATNGPSVRVQGKRYRGRMLVYLNDRGMLNLINELPVEEYLRGVVPSEMGPIQYNQVEALKAQAVAARTYTLRNLGEFSREGYDICATPRCQVYKGMEVEHSLSDRAVAETAGHVLTYGGRLIDALYSSTCGGHTEDVHIVFPLKQEPYLKAVPCMEEGLVRLRGNLQQDVPFPDGLTGWLMPAASGVSPPQALAARIEHLALMAGLPAPRERLSSLDRREVQRYVAYAFDLALDARLFLAPQDVAYLLNDPPRDWSEEDLRRAAYLVKSGLMSGPLDQPLNQGEIESMMLALAELLQAVRREEVSYLSMETGQLAVRSGKEDRVYELPASVSTFRRRGQEVRSADLLLLPGDRVTLFWQADRIVAAVQDVDLDGVAFDRSSPYSSWTRFRSDSQLAKQVNTRFPGVGFRDLEILERGPSGRVGKIRIQGESQVVEVEGLAVRWTLDVPDTLFTAKRLTPQNKEAGWLFTGSGFGHGVGMCQIGSYGMAQRGHTYRDILTHYYSGVELGRVRWSTAQSVPGPPPLNPEPDARTRAGAP